MKIERFGIIAEIWCCVSVSVSGLTPGVRYKVSLYAVTTTGVSVSSSSLVYSKEQSELHSTHNLQNELLPAILNLRSEKEKKQKLCIRLIVILSPSDCMWISTDSWSQLVSTAPCGQTDPDPVR